LCVSVGIWRASCFRLLVLLYYHEQFHSIHRYCPFINITSINSLDTFIFIFR